MTGSNHKVDAAMVSLVCLLPPGIAQLWWDTAALSGCLRRAGVTGISPERLGKALFTTQRLTLATPWKCRRWKNTRYYLFGKALEDFTPKTQYNHFLATRHQLPTVDNHHFFGTQEHWASFSRISRWQNQHFFPTTTKLAL
jgi:hypothetical protein